MIILSLVLFSVTSAYGQAPTQDRNCPCPKVTHNAAKPRAKANRTVPRYPAQDGSASATATAVATVSPMDQQLLDLLKADKESQTQLMKALIDKIGDAAINTAKADLAEATAKETEAEADKLSAQNDGKKVDAEIEGNKQLGNLTPEQFRALTERGFLNHEWKTHRISAFLDPLGMMGSAALGSALLRPPKSFVSATGGFATGGAGGNATNTNSNSSNSTSNSRSTSSSKSSSTSKSSVWNSNTNTNNNTNKNSNNNDNWNNNSNKNENKNTDENKDDKDCRSW